MRPAAYSSAQLLHSKAQQTQRTADVYPLPASTTGLLQRYRTALAELDARPAQYTPRNRPTEAGARLLLQRDIEAADAAARRDRQDQQDTAAAETAAAAELYRQQHEHPLYNTLHRPDLLRYWQGNGTPPQMPTKALDRFTPWITRHSASDEDDVRRFAEALTRASYETLQDHLGEYANRYDPARIEPTEQTEKNLRRTLRAAFRQFNEQAAHILQKVGARREKYVSDLTLRTRRNQLAAQIRWIEATTANDGENTVRLSDCIRTAEARQSELYTLCKGQESYFISQGYTPLFVTVTTPPQYHPAPSYGQTSWDGSTPTDSHQYLTKRWARVRAKLWKKHHIRLDGFRVTEPHKDGAEHWHMMLYLKPEHMEIVADAIDSKFKHSAHAVTYKHDFDKPDPAKDRATAAAYMLKYIIKTLGGDAAEGTSAANDDDFMGEADRADAWRSTWGIRGFQFFGVLGGKITTWRELRRIKTQPEEPDACYLWRSARGGRGHHFIAKVREMLRGASIDDTPPLAIIKEVTEVWTDPDPDTGEAFKTGYKAGRVLGLQINGVQYLTHGSKWTLDTDFSLLNSGDTVIPKYPRATHKKASPIHPPPDGDPQGGAIPSGERGSWHE